MIACVDIQAAVTQRAGVGRYTKNLVEQLGGLRGADRLRLCYFDFKRKGQPFPAAGADFHAVRWCPGRMAQAAWKYAGLPPYDFFSGPADVFHFPNFIRPPLAHGRSVVTIHDVAFLRYPETTEARNLRYLQHHLAQTVARADAIIAVSDFVAAEICERLQVAREKVVAIHSGFDATMKRPADDITNAFRKTNQLAAPYLLHVGTLEPRKNLPFLFKVLERLEREEILLVLAGAPGWKYEPILQALQQSPARNRIRRLQHVNDTDLPALYAGAAALVMPSLYEGFGFPPLEAMACGTPVVVSDGGALPEIAGPAARVLRGFEVEEWAAALRDILNSETQRTSMIARGLEWIRRYDWRTAAEKTWALYRRVVAGGAA